MDKFRIIGIRYWAHGDSILDTYGSSGVDVVEPVFPETRRVEDEPTNLGILVVGGDCSHCRQIGSSWSTYAISTLLKNA